MKNCVLPLDQPGWSITSWAGAAQLADVQAPVPLYEAVTAAVVSVRLS